MLARSEPTPTGRRTRSRSAWTAAGGGSFHEGSEASVDARSEAWRSPRIHISAQNLWPHAERRSARRTSGSDDERAVPSDSADRMKETTVLPFRGTTLGGYAGSRPTIAKPEAVPRVRAISGLSLRWLSVRASM